MADQTHSTNNTQNHDTFTGRSAGENIYVTGGPSCKLVINSEPQYTPMGLLGRVDIDDGELHIDGTTVRHLPYKVWTERQPVGDYNKNWQSLACSADGSVMIACVYGGRVYTSSNGGVSWTERQPAGDFNKNWNSVACDSDGSVMIACISNGRLYTSSNGGVSWTERQPAGDFDKDWNSVACDSDGSVMMVCISNGRLYTSANSGVDWTERQPAGDFDKDWNGVTCDSDGSVMMVCIAPGRLYTSANSGVDWTERQPAGDNDKSWYGLACDSDGSVMMACALNGRLYTSANSGVDWTERQPAGNFDKDWISIACNTNGATMYACVADGRVYSSINTGANWTERFPGDADSNFYWQDVSCDSTGSVVILCVLGGRLYVGGGNALSLIGAGDIVEGRTSSAYGEVLRNIDESITGYESGYLKIREVTGTFSSGEVIDDQGDSWYSLVTSGADDVGTLLILLEESNTTETNPLGIFRITGEYYDLGESDGSADQTFECWHADVLAGVWVETGDGTDVWEFWPNIGQSGWSNYGNGSLGKVCQMTWNDPTITFGDDTNGTIPVTGARVRVPNVHLASSTTGSSPTPTRNATLATRHEIRYNGKHYFDKVSLGCVQTDGAFSIDMEFTNMIVSRAFKLIYILGLTTHTNVHCGGDGGGTGGSDGCTNYTNEAGFSYCIGGITLSNCSFFFGTNGALFNGMIDNVTINDITIRYAGLRSSSAYIRFYIASNVTVNGFKIYGCGVTFQGENISLYDVVYADSNDAVLRSANSLYAIQNNRCGNFLLDGMTIEQDCVPYNSLVQTQPDTSGSVIIRNIGSKESPIDLQSHCGYGVYLESTLAQRIEHLYVENARISVSTLTRNNGRFRWMSNIGIEAGILNSAYWKGGDTIGRGLWGYAGDVSTSWSYAKGLHFLDMYLNDDAEGRLHLIFTEPSDWYFSENYVTVSEGIRWDSGKAKFESIDASIIYEWPFYIKGYTSFMNAAPVLAGGETTKFNVYYQIDINDGNGWNGSWKEATGANLSGESISPDTGFKIKLRLTLNDTPSSTYLNRFYLRLNASSADFKANQYNLEDFVDVILTNIVDGSKYYVLNRNTNEEIRGVQSGSGPINLKMPYHGQEEDLLISVRNASDIVKYRPTNDIVILTEDGIRFRVVQLPVVLSS